MENEKKGIQLTRQPSEQQVSVINGQIQIRASEKPITTNFSPHWGWVYFILDYSGSMRKGTKLEQAKTGIMNFARDAFKKNYRVGLIKFSDEAELLCEPSDNLQIIQSSLDGIEASRSTNLTAAISLAHSKLKGFLGPRVMVIATDGMPFSVKTSLEAADKAKADAIDIITIGTDDAKIKFLNQLASRNELSSLVENKMLAEAISNAAFLLPGHDTQKLEQGK